MINFIREHGVNLMEITVINGEKEEVIEVSSDKTIKDVLEIMDIPTETVVVKKNDYIVIDEELVTNGDIIEVIQVIYGG